MEDRTGYTYPRFGVGNSHARSPHCLASRRWSGSLYLFLDGREPLGRERLHGDGAVGLIVAIQAQFRPGGCAAIRLSASLGPALRTELRPFSALQPHSPSEAEMQTGRAPPG